MIEDEVTGDFDVLLNWYSEALDRAEYAEFTLLVYHHFVCLFDVDEVRTRREQSIRGVVPEWATDEHKAYEVAVSDAKRRLEGVHRDDVQKVLEATDGLNSASRTKLVPDTPKTLYRWNHISDSQWAGWTFDEKQTWIKNTVKKHGKTVVA